MNRWVEKNVGGDGMGDDETREGGEGNDGGVEVGLYVKVYGHLREYKVCYATK